MTLIKSISGIRGTIGGRPGESLTPPDIVGFTSAYATWLQRTGRKLNRRIVIGRDARVSGPILEQLVAATLNGMGFNVVMLGLATTPTVEIAVPLEKADGGIILTASHNPAQWNALKLLNHEGEFLSAADGNEIVGLAERSDFTFASFDQLGKCTYSDDYSRKHIEMVKNLKLVDTEKIRAAGFRVVIDGVNSVGGLIIPDLLRELGVKEVTGLNTEANGLFQHNPEPLPENLTAISEKVKETGADVGFVVDPDVDRLAIVNEDGTMFGEEYTLVAVADYVLSRTPGNTASNLSSTRALRDITEKSGYTYTASAVGEVNVVEAMKANHCVIGGEGNGGIIFPALHYGRDALVGIALFLTHLADTGLKCSDLRRTYPEYVISKNKISLREGINVDAVLSNVKSHFSAQLLNESDGLKIDFPDSWVHLRKSNTEPIIRIYAEHADREKADELANRVMKVILDFIS